MGKDSYLQDASWPEACKKDERTSSIWEGRGEGPRVFEDDLLVTAQNLSFIVPNKISNHTFQTVPEPKEQHIGKSLQQQLSKAVQAVFLEQSIPSLANLYHFNSNKAENGKSSGKQQPR